MTVNGQQESKRVLSFPIYCKHKKHLYYNHKHKRYETDWHNPCCVSPSEPKREGEIVVLEVKTNDIYSVKI